jgi:sugar (pentulose or hexulose) kinase
MKEDLRGIAVLDIGATSSKLVLFDAELKPLAERKIASRHVPGPPYAHIDPEPVFAMARAALPEFDNLLPVDVIVPSAHGAALACLAADGSLALPVMDYLAEPPPEIVADYRKIEPPFSEVFGPLLPMALTHGLQLYWQERALPADFARVDTIMPWIQYAPFRLAGKRVSEISGLACQSQLVDVRTGGFSSLARARGWDRKIAPVVKAWESVGALLPEYRGENFQGRGAVLAGVHDSNANYLRYLATGAGSFTLLSTGTWIIGFDTDAKIDSLDAARDTVTNTDVFGRQVACCRFFGGKEFEVIAGTAAADAASLACVERLIARGTSALPSFTDSGGPVPDTGGKGRFMGPPPATPEERASIASLYCALMCDRSLDAIGSKAQVIIDGPFAKNAVFMAVLAALRPAQAVLASDLRDGTTAGAAVLALMHPDGALPRLSLKLEKTEAAVLPGLKAYAETWLAAV